MRHLRMPMRVPARSMLSSTRLVEGKVSQFPTVAGAFAKTFGIGLDRGSLVSKEAAARQPYTQSLGKTCLNLK